MIIAVIGKGGVGKTTITALLLRRLLDAGEKPVLAVDADPSNCLGPVLGVEITRTLAEVRDELREDVGSPKSEVRSPKSEVRSLKSEVRSPKSEVRSPKSEVRSPESEGPKVRRSEGPTATRPPSMAKSDWLALQAEEAIVEHAGFDLLTMGHSEGPGCYCFVNNLIRNHLDRLARSYRHVLVDCEAGLEHLSRRTSGRPDRLVCVANGSRMSQETVRRALDLYRGLNGTLPRVDLIVNGRSEGPGVRRSEGPGGQGSEGPGVRRSEGPGGRGSEGPKVGRSEGEGIFASVIHVPWDEGIAELDAAGTSLLALDAASPALAALGDWVVR